MIQHRQITTYALDDHVDPCLPVEVIEAGVVTHATIDLGAGPNFITYDLFKTLLEMQMIKEAVKCVAFNGTEANTMGYAKLPVYIKDMLSAHKSYIFDIDDQETPIVLGATWQRRYKDYLHFSDDQVYFHVDQSR
ncbi:hypothetical protein GOP47_0019371 [Adiantum capillus-veneris]|uniref:Uncharacterized protein n=1 Tax=Adiantum capillus-veneris TaxID=13818 RepID=A0A9D4Z9J9_ADICA|nr:hypothetical protein GOP47_0019371 [Adiantum capillus-veneris]